MKWNVLSCMFAFIFVCAVAGCNRDTNVSLNLAEAEKWHLSIARGL